MQLGNRCVMNRLYSIYVRLRPLCCRAIIAVIAVMCVGCGAGAAIEDVERAEALLEESPNEALAIIQQVDAEENFSEEERAYYRLVYSEALYHNFVDSDVDTLTRPMADYYMASDDHARRSRALYQHALVLQRMGNLAEAMIMLMEAEASLTEVADDKLLALVSRTEGDIYCEGCLFSNAMDCYNVAYSLFVSEELGYHAASMLYDMGGTLIQLRDFAGAEEALEGALAYAVESGPEEFLCGVLHELLDLSIYLNDYDMCGSYIEAFSTYDCLLFGASHYTAVVAMYESYHGNTEQALELLEEATTMEGVEWADLEYACYIVYRNAGDTAKALEWQEHSKNAQDSLMLEVLEQPVLNMEIDMLNAQLSAEQREQELLRQRNILVTIAVIVVVLSLGVFIVLRIRRKNQAIAQYVETIRELEYTLNNVPQPMTSSVTELYQDRFTELNELCDTYYDHSGSSRHKSMVFNKLTSIIQAIEQDSKRLVELEDRVNTYRNGLMVKLREQMPRLSERDTRVALYVFAGFSNRAIAIFIDSDPVSVSKMKYNIRRKIQTANIPAGEELAEALI